MKPIKRALVRVGKRDKSEFDLCGYYNPVSQEIYLVRPYYLRTSRLEDDVLKTIEHETLHHVLLNRIGSEAYDKLDNIHSLLLGFITLKKEVAGNKLKFRLNTI